MRIVFKWHRAATGSDHVESLNGKLSAERVNEIKFESLAHAQVVLKCGNTTTVSTGPTAPSGT